MADAVDRSSTLARMNALLDIDPATCAVVTIDCQRGNLEPEIASLPVPADECKRVIAGTNRLLATARKQSIAIIHVTTVYEAPLLGQHPFERAMLQLKESFSPHAKSDFARHKSPGSIEGQIVPALDVQPTDLLVDSKRTFDAFLGTPLELLLKFTQEDAPGFQLIVTEHANLRDEWWPRTSESNPLKCSRSTEHPTRRNPSTTGC